MRNTSSPTPGSSSRPTLARHLGVRQLFEANVDLGDAPGRANVGHKAMTIIHSALAGGDSIDDCDVLRAGWTQAVVRGYHSLVAVLAGTGDEVPSRLRGGNANSG